MAIDWGAWEYSGGNGMRVGLEVSWTTPSNGSTGAIATVDIYTQNQYTYGDDQTLSYGGSISGSTAFNNNDGGTAQLRATKTYNYSYISGSYGSSPGNKTFTATLSGAFNGVTPTNSLTSAIPARPIAAPDAPTNVSVARISDSSQKTTWTNNDSNAKPWDTIGVQRSVDGGTYSTVGAPGGTATSYTDSSTDVNHRYRYQVRSGNSQGVTSYVLTSGYVWTTPSAPTITAALTPVAGPTGQRVFWTNTCGYPLTSEFQTDITGWKNGVSVGVIGTVAGSAASQFDHTTANGVSAYTTTDRWKYSVTHRTTSGTSLSSASSAFSNETPGTTTPPLVPLTPQPNGLTVDPTLGIILSWVFNPGQVGDTQTKFDVQHRKVGGSTWTTNTTTTGTNAYTIPAGTYAVNDVVEWQVRTYGSDPVPGPYTAVVSFTTALSVILPDPITWPARINSLTGAVEADTTAFVVRDLVQRAQSQLVGGGIRAVDASFGISWSLRFVLASLGNTDVAFPQGYHDIINPYGWAISNKALTSNIATITYGTATNGSRIRPGDYITVSGVGAPFDGRFVARSVTSVAGGTGTVTYDCVNANVTSAAATGTVSCTIEGHGGAVDTVPTGGKITLNNWDALYYELPLAWGAGTTPRKNGVVTITNTVLTSNKATFTTQTQHAYAVGDLIVITGCGSPYNGERTVTDIGANSFSAAITNANVGSAGAAGLAQPTGKTTFFGNFHVVNLSTDFVVPSNWIMIAIKNGDTLNVEWASGDKMPASYDSTVYNIGGQKISHFDSGSSGTVATNASGETVVNHSLGVVPNYVIVGNGPGGGAQCFPCLVYSFTSTTFTIRWRQIVTAVAGSSTAPVPGSGVNVSAHFIAIAV